MEITGIAQDTLLAGGSSFVAGGVVGYAIKKVAKLIAIIAGGLMALWVGSIEYLRQQGYITGDIHWNEFFNDTFAIFMGNSEEMTNQFVNIITGYLPMAGGFGAGLFLGLKKA